MVETALTGQVVTDLHACWDRVLFRHRTAKDTSERWYHGGTPRSETASRPEVTLSDSVEEESVEHVPVASPALGLPRPSKSRSSRSKRKRGIPRSPMKLPRKFEISTTLASSQRRFLVEDPSFVCSSTGQVSRGK